MPVWEGGREGGKEGGREERNGGESEAGEIDTDNNTSKPCVLLSQVKLPHVHPEV